MSSVESTETTITGARRQFVRFYNPGVVPVRLIASRFSRRRREQQEGRLRTYEKAFKAQSASSLKALAAKHYELAPRRAAPLSKNLQ